MSCSSLHQAAKTFAGLGLLAKIDNANLYRNVPIHLQDRFLLGMQWDSAIYVDSVRPFGLQFVPKIFSAIVDTLARADIHTEPSISRNTL